MMAALAAAVLPVAPGAAMGKDKQGDRRATWVGAWTAGPEHNITISSGPGGVLAIEGFATWGASDPQRVESGGVNVGEFYAEVPGDWIVGTQLAFGVGVDGTVRADAAEEFDCVVQLEIQEAELFVSDNGMCGGHNVRFNGVYERTE